MMSSTSSEPVSVNGILHAAGGYGPPGGGGYGGGYGGAPPPGGPGGGGYGGAPPGGGGGGYGGPPGFGPPGGFPPPGGPMGPMMPGAGGDVNTMLPLILNIVGALFCWGTCVGFILSVVGIVFAVQAGNAKNAGDLVTAKGKAKTSILMFIITAVLGVLGAVGYAVVGAITH